MSAVAVAEHVPHLESTTPRGVVRFRDTCSCGWAGDWQPNPGLAHAAHDHHVDEVEDRHLEALGPP